MVGFSKMARRGRGMVKSRRMRVVIWVARREWPPSSKKLSWVLMVVVPRTVAQMSWMAFSWWGRGWGGWGVGGRGGAVDRAVEGEGKGGEGGDGGGDHVGGEVSGEVVADLLVCGRGGGGGGDV